MAAVRPAPVAAVDGGQALVERDAARARIDQCLRGAIAGHGSLPLLEGPAGIGKTRLILAAELPNERWQSDFICWHLVGGTRGGDRVLAR